MGGLMQGWVTVFSWIVDVGVGLAVLSDMIPSLIIFNDESYEATGWKSTLYMLVAFVAGPLMYNLFTRESLNIIENITGVNPDLVFRTPIADVNGWTNPGIAWYLGLLAVVFPISGSDGCCTWAG
ncbi:hypothetical protein V8F06_007812 [Rhypophila decipiens]